MEDGVYKNNTGIPHAVIITITMFSRHLIFPLSVICQATAKLTTDIWRGLKNYQARCKPVRLLNGDSKRGRNVCSLTSKPFSALLCSPLQGLSVDLASTQKVINKSCPPSISPCGVFLFYSPMGAIFSCKLLS